jgi:hypothetical protein
MKYVPLEEEGVLDVRQFGAKETANRKRSNNPAKSIVCIYKLLEVRGGNSNITKFRRECKCLDENF